MTFRKTASHICALLALALALLPIAAHSQEAPKQEEPPKQEAPKQEAQPSAKPDFSGRWRMIKDKSDFGGFKIPDAVVRVIEHRDPTLNVHTIQTIGAKTTTADVSYYTDGSLTSNIINGHDASSKAFWDGPALVIRTNMKDSKGEDVVIEDRWELSDDQQTLTTTSHIETPKGQVDMKLVCVREKASG